MATQAERKARTKRQLIDAAKTLFEQHGFDAVSVAQIVKAADVAKGTFYQHYETKIDVLADVVRDEGEDKFKQALEAVRQGASALGMLESFLKIQCQWFENNEKVAEALVMSALKTVGQEKNLEKNRHSRYFQTALMKLAQEQGEVRDDIDAREMAKVIGSAVVISVLAWAKDPQPNVLYPSVQESLKIFLQGVQVRNGDQYEQ